MALTVLASKLVTTPLLMFRDTWVDLFEPVTFTAPGGLVQSSFVFKRSPSPDGQGGTLFQYQATLDGQPWPEEAFFQLDAGDHTVEMRGEYQAMVDKPDSGYLLEFGFVVVSLA